VECVAIVFGVFDDRNQNARISLPQKNTVDLGYRIAGNEILYFAIGLCKHHDRNIQARLSYLLRQLRGIHLSYCQVGDNQVEAGLRTRKVESLHTVGNMGDARNVLQVEFAGFADQEFVEASVFAQNEGVIEIGNEEYVADPEWHQAIEAFERFFRVEKRIASVETAHESAL